MTATCLTLLGLLVTQPEPAGARALGPPAIALTASTSAALSLALDTLPDSTGLAMVIARPAGMSALEAVWEEVAALTGLPPGPLADLLLVRTFGPEPGALSNTSRWSGIGLDAKAPLIVVPALGAAPAMLRAEISDRARLQAWLAALPGHERIARKDEAAAEIVAEGVACAIVGSALFCQRGSSPGQDPLADLWRWAERPSRRLAHLRPVAAAASRLGGAMDAYAILRPGTLGPVIEREALQHAQSSAAFKGPAAQREALLEARRVAQRWASWAGSISAAALGLSMRQGRVETRAEVELDDRLAAALEDTLGTERIAPGIARWSTTPALARAALRLDRAMLAEGLRAMGFSISPEGLGGSAALLVLGLDADCPAAKDAQAPLERALPSLLPMAMAMSLSAKGKTVGEGSATRFNEGRPAAEARIEGETLLIASGPGGVAAAVRRLESSAGRGIPRSSFFDGSIDLAAVGAAIEAGDLDDHARPELRSLRDTYRRMRPLFDRFRTLELSLQAEGRGHRVRAVAAGY